QRSWSVQLRWRGYSSVLLFLSLGGCLDENRVEGFADGDWQVLRSLSPIPKDIPPDPTNAVADEPAAAGLGQKLFFERSYAGPLAVGDDGTNGGIGPQGAVGRVACVSCHLSEWWDDTRSMPPTTSLGADRGKRNAPTMVNMQFYRFFHWDGRADAIWVSSLVPPENPKS